MRERLKTAAQEGLITAVRWLVAPLILVLVLGGSAFLAYDYYQTRTATREVVGAINSGRLLQLLGEQQKAAAAQAAQVAQPRPAAPAPAAPR